MSSLTGLGICGLPVSYKYVVPDRTRDMAKIFPDVYNRPRTCPVRDKIFIATAIILIPLLHFKTKQEHCPKLKATHYATC
jgi:hypothetical protein